MILQPGSLGGIFPERRMRVSQQHRFVIRGWQAELLFGSDEVLVAARDLANDRTIRIDTTRSAVAYFRLLFDRHELIWADGAETESLHPAGLARMGLPKAMLDEIAALFPDANAKGARFRTTVRPCLNSWEGRLLIG